MVGKQFFLSSILVACTIVLGIWTLSQKNKSTRSELVSKARKQESVSRGTSEFVDSRSWPSGTTKEGRDSLWCRDTSPNDPRCLKIRRNEVVREGWSPAFTRSEAADYPHWTGLEVPSDWRQSSVRLASDADLERIKKANRGNEFESDWTQYPYDVGSYADGDGLFSNHENANDKAMAAPDETELPKDAERYDALKSR